jgi:hypothetical protein
MIHIDLFLVGFLFLAPTLLNMYLSTPNLIQEVSYAGWHSSAVNVPAGKQTGVHPLFQNFATI